MLFAADAPSVDSILYYVGLVIALLTAVSAFIKDHFQHKESTARLNKLEEKVK